MITLIDSNNLLHRVFYTHDGNKYRCLNCNYECYGFKDSCENCGEKGSMDPAGLKTSDGLPIGCVYGFLNSVYSIFKNRKKRERFVFVWDSYSKRKKQIYAGYKGKRLAKSDDIYFQKDEIKKFLQVLNIQQIEIEGEEADDVIATLVKKARQEKEKVTIYSKDHDFDQMINKNVKVFFPDGKKSYTKDVNWVLNKYGIEPSKLADVMRIIGDGGDDASIRDLVEYTGEWDKEIFGKTMPGEKTAIKLIKANGNIDNLMRDVYEAKTLNTKGELTKISKGLAKKLDHSRKAMNLLDELVVLKGDLEFYFEFKKEIKPNWDLFVEKCEEFEFKSLVKRLRSWQNAITYEKKI